MDKSLHDTHTRRKCIEQSDVDTAFDHVSSPTLSENSEKRERLPCRRTIFHTGTYLDGRIVGICGVESSEVAPPLSCGTISIKEKTRRTRGRGDLRGVALVRVRQAIMIMVHMARPVSSPAEVM